MAVTPVPLWLGMPGRRLFATWYAGESRPRAVVVICPPLFYEHFLSYRLFGLVAARLAAAGIACLRVDYFGTGDSEGTGADFSVHGAQRDIGTALTEARSRAQGTPIALLGIRAGVWPAWSVAANDPGIGSLWIWQPIIDGSDYLAQLHQRDAEERKVRTQYPFYNAPSTYSDDKQLVGYTCPDALYQELGRARLPGEPLHSHTRIGVLGNSQTLEQVSFADMRIELVAASTHWADSMRVRALFLNKELAQSVDAFATKLGRNHDR